MKKIRLFFGSVILLSFCFANIQEQEVQDNIKKETFVPYDTAPKMTSELHIEYPDSAKNLGLQGEVIVTAFINKEGKITTLRIKEGEGDPVFNEAAKNAVRNSTWEPAYQKKEPVGVWIKIPVHFRLNDEKVK